MYYKRRKEVEETKKQIKSVLNTAADKNFITTEELKNLVGLLSAAQEVTQRI